MLKDVMEMAIEDKLDQRLFPFLSGRGSGSVSTGVRRYASCYREERCVFHILVTPGKTKGIVIIMSVNVRRLSANICLLTR